MIIWIFINMNIILNLDIKEELQDKKLEKEIKESSELDSLLSKISF